MEIRTVITGTLDENCYILTKNNTCLIVDPGDDYLKIKEEVKDNKILGILITHSHFDHIGALRHFLGKKSVKIFKKSNVLENEYKIGDFTFKVIYNPGHSKDSISFYFAEENIMFVGDFIFKETIGRTDLPGGSSKEMEESLNKLKKYPLETTLYPGHGAITTLGLEIKNNPYIK